MTESGCILNASSSSAGIRLSSISSHMTVRNPTKSQNRFKVVVTRNMGEDAMARLNNTKELNVLMWPEDRPCDRNWLLDNVRGANAVLNTLNDKIDEELLDAAGSDLKVVSTMSVGYEHVNAKALAARGIRLGYTPDVLTDAVADLSVMLALMAGRNAGELIPLVNNGEWPGIPWAPFGFCGPQLSTLSIGSTSPERIVGFIGFGRIAQATLARLVPFGITGCVYYSNPSSPPKIELERAILSRHVNTSLKFIKRVDLDDLAKSSDVVFVLAPGGPTTYHIINEDFLRKMKWTAVLVNTARGTLIDSNALARALNEHWIWGAGLDVVEGEPNVGHGHPLVGLKRCVVLPHVGSATNETRWGMANMAVNNLLGGLELRPEGMVAEVLNN